MTPSDLAEATWPTNWRVPESLVEMYLGELMCSRMKTRSGIPDSAWESDYRSDEEGDEEESDTRMTRDQWLLQKILQAGEQAPGRVMPTEETDWLSTAREGLAIKETAVDIGRRALAMIGDTRQRHHRNQGHGTGRQQMKKRTKKPPAQWSKRRIREARAATES
jgi:hypothetical protein